MSARRGLAAKFGHATVDELTATDVAQLGAVYESLKQGTVTVDDEFPDVAADRIKPADIAGTPRTPRPRRTYPPRPIRR